MLAQSRAETEVQNYITIVVYSGNKEKEQKGAGMPAAHGTLHIPAGGTLARTFSCLVPGSLSVELGFIYTYVSSALATAQRGE